MEVKPTYLPSVPRIFEKLYTLAQPQLRRREEIAQAIRSVGGKVRDLEVARRGRSRRSCATQFDAGRRASCSRTCATLFGGRLREAVTGAAPIAQEILEFFCGCGVPVLEGYGMTETSTAATYSTPEDHKFGTVGRRAARRRGQDRRRRRDPHQGREHLPAATTRTTTRRSAPSRTAGCTPATSARSTRTATCRSPAARRTSSSPRAARTSRRPTSRTTSSRRAGSPRR